MTGGGFSLREADDLIRRGNEAIKKGDLEAAYASWKAAAGIDPSRREALDEPMRKLRAKIVSGCLAHAREAARHGHVEAATEAYRKLLDFDPDDPAVREESRRWIAGKERRSLFASRAMVLVAFAAAFTVILLLAFGVYHILQ